MRGSDRSPSCDIQTYNSRHAGHIFSSSLTVFIEYVDLAGLKSNRGMDLDNTSRPVANIIEFFIKEKLTKEPCVRDPPQKYCCTEGAHSQIHQAISIHIHIAMDTTTKVLQTRGQLNCSNPLTERGDGCKINNYSNRTHSNNEYKREQLDTYVVPVYISSIFCCVGCSRCKWLLCDHPLVELPPPHH